MTTSEQRRAGSVNGRVQNAEDALMRAHGLSKALEFMVVGAAHIDGPMEPLPFSTFLNSLEEVNDAVHNAINAALDELNLLRIGAVAGGAT